jgi:hypothetical protein
MWMMMMMMMMAVYGIFVGKHHGRALFRGFNFSREYNTGSRTLMHPSGAVYLNNYGTVLFV